MSKPLKIFITYAHKNKEAKDQLIECLDVMKREGLISVWHDNEMIGGDKWREDIFKHLADSDMLLYLVSTASLASDNCNKELAEALSAEIRVIPIILESCDWLHYKLSNFQALPDKGKPIDKWQPESDGWQNVIEGIREAIDKMQVQVEMPLKASEKKLRAELAFQQGNVLIMLRQTNSAIEHYSHAIELDPNLAEAYNNRGNAYCDIGEVDRAIEDYIKMIELQPNDAIAYNNRGIAYGIKDEINLAIKDFNAAIQLKRDYAIAYNNRGAVYRSKGDYDRAIEDCNKAIDLERDYAEPYSNRGAAYRNKGDYDRAIEDHNTAIQLKPDFVEAYYNRGIVYYEKHEFDRAIADYNAAIERKPDLAPAYNNRGNAYSRKGDDKLAIEDYTTTIELEPEIAEAYYSRGVAWLRLREWERAKADLTIAREKGLNIILVFRKEYESVDNFDGKHGVKLPADIATMLTPRIVAMRKKEAQEGTEEVATDAEIALDEMLTNYERAWKILATR